MMRLHVRIPEDLKELAQSRAVAEGKTVSAVVRDLLTVWAVGEPDSRVTRAEVAAEVAGVVEDALKGWAG